MYRKLKYKSIEGEGNFLDILPKTLTYQMGKKVWSETQSKTIFKEVTQYCEKVDDGDYCYLKDKNWKKIIFTAFVESVDKLWDNSKQQVVSHSSGYDSRILSMAIKELGKDAIFVEIGGEGEYFRKVMSYFGWKDHIVVPQILDMDITSIWEQFYAPVGYPINPQYSPFKKLVEGGILPKGCQYFSGQGQNEVEKTTEPTIRKKKRKYYGFTENLALNNFKQWEGPWEMPFLDKDYLATRFKYEVGANMSYNLLESEELKSIPKETTASLKKKGIKIVDNMDRAVSQFKNTYLGGLISARPYNVLDYCEWWGHWVASSFIEKIKDTHNIIIN